MGEKINLSDKLAVSFQEKDGIHYLSFAGDIDEDFKFQVLTHQKGKKYLIDFNQISMINSCGIREWINFLEALGPEVQIIYVNCPQIIIQQVNMVDGFLSKKSAVHTFYAPYYCENCDLEKRFLIKSSDVVDFAAPEAQCENCGEEMEFDAHEKQYFQFITRNNEG